MDRNTLQYGGIRVPQEEKKTKKNQKNLDPGMADHDGDENNNINTLNVIRNEEEYFHNWCHVLEFLEEIIDPIRWKEAWDHKWEAISTSLLIFQEQPTLLTPHLEKIILPLTNYLIEILQQQEEERKKFQV